MTNEDKTYLKKLIFENATNDLLNDNDFIEKLARKMVNDKASKEQIEKFVKKIVAACSTSFFKSLWMKKDFYENEILRGSI